MSIEEMYEIAQGRNLKYGIEGYEIARKYPDKEYNRIYEEFDPKNKSAKPPRAKQGKYDLNAKRGDPNADHFKEQKFIPGPGSCKLNYST